MQLSERNNLMKTVFEDAEKSLFTISISFANRNKLRSIGIRKSPDFVPPLTHFISISSFAVAFYCKLTLSKYFPFI